MRSFGVCIVALALVLTACGPFGSKNADDRDWISFAKVRPVIVGQKPKPRPPVLARYRCGLFGKCTIAEFIQRQNVCALIAVKNDKIRVYQETSNHPKCASDLRRQRNGLASVTKSITSLMIGDLLMRKPNLDLDTPIDQALAPLGIRYPVKERTIRDLLQMSSRMVWSERNIEIVRIEKSAGPSDPKTLAEAVRRHLAKARFHTGPNADPFNYSGFDTQVLGLILLAHGRGTQAEQFERTLWKMIEGGFEGKWKADTDKNPSSYCCLQLAPADVAAFGRWVLKQYNSQNGKYQAWLHKSVSDKRNSDLKCGGQHVQYGYQWWVLPDPNDGFTAIGQNGQLVHIFPKQNVVIVQLSAFPGFRDSIARCETFRAHRALADAL